MAAQNTNLQFQIPHFSQKLTSTNYILWRAQIEPMLRAQNLFHHIDGTTVPPSPTITEAVGGSSTETNEVPNPAYAPWSQEDQRILTLISFSVSDSLLPQVVGCRTAREAWERLTRVYASGSRAHIKRLKTSLYELTKGSDSIDDYLQRVKVLRDQLAALGHSVPEDDLVERVLNGLDDEYRPFIRSIEARLDPVSLEDLHAYLLSEEMTIRRLAPQPAELIPSANYSSRGRGGASRGGRVGRGRPNSSSGGSSGFNSGTGILGSGPNLGSGRGTSYGREGNFQSGPSHNPDVQCHNCRGYGHISRYCSSARRSGSARSGPQAHHASSPRSQWVLDSGTTHHLTSDLGNLAIHSEYTGPEEVTFGHEGGASSRPE